MIESASLMQIGVIVDDSKVVPDYKTASSPREKLRACNTQLIRLHWDEEKDVPKYESFL
jgi:hypothetical protein